MSQTRNGFRLTSICVTAVALLLLNCFPAQSQEDNKKQLRQFVGSWEGSGTLFGKPARFQLSFSLALNDKFFHLEFRNEYSVESRTYAMEAKAFYALSQDSLRGYWFDSRGVQQPVTVGLGPSTLTSFWGTPLTERGKTVYELIDESELRVTDFVQRNGAYAIFGEARYKRIK